MLEDGQYWKCGQLIPVCGHFRLVILDFPALELLCLGAGSKMTKAEQIVMFWRSNNAMFSPEFHTLKFNRVAANLTTDLKHTVASVK